MLNNQQRKAKNNKMKRSGSDHYLNVGVPLKLYKNSNNLGATLNSQNNKHIETNIRLGSDNRCFCVGTKKRLKNQVIIKENNLRE